MASDSEAVVNILTWLLKSLHILKNFPYSIYYFSKIKAEREPDPLSIKDLQNESIKTLSMSDDDIEIIDHIKQEVKIKTEEEIIAKPRDKS